MFSDRLKELRKQHKITQERLAQMIGVERSSIGKYETGVIPSPGILKAIANYFDVSIDFLLDNDSSQATRKQNTVVKIPVLGHVAAGIPIEAIEDIIDYEELPAAQYNDGDYFGLRVKGDSMEPRIMEDDVVIVRKQPDVESGEIAVILVNGYDATVKRLVKHENGISLIALNAAYPPKFYTCDEINRLPIEVVGKVVELRGKF